METYVPDASVLLKWVLPPEDEQWVAQALALRQAMLEDKARLLVPTLWLFEAGNTLARKFPDIAPSRLSVLSRSGFSESSMTPDVRTRAFELCAVHNVTFYDVGEAGVRLYASGQPGGARADRLLFQAKLALDDKARLKVVRKMYELRFGEPPPERRSIEQLRGIEGARVRKTYQLLAKRHGVTWSSPACLPNRRGQSKRAGTKGSSRMSRPVP